MIPYSLTESKKTRQTGATPNRIMWVFLVLRNIPEIKEKSSTSMKNEPTNERMNRFSGGEGRKQIWERRKKKRVRFFRDDRYFCIRLFD